MDSFKTPAGALTAVNSAAIMGVLYYLQRQITELSDNQEKIDGSIKRLYGIVLGQNGKQYEEIKEFVSTQKRNEPKNQKAVAKIKEESEKYRENIDEMKQQLDTLISQLSKENPELKQIEPNNKKEKEKVKANGKKPAKKEEKKDSDSEDIMS